MKKLFVLSFLLFVATVYTIAQSSPVGVWRTVDDNTGESRSHVEIYKKNGKLYGKITKLLQSEPGTLCDECPGDKKNKPVLGMVIIEDLQSYKDYWRKGSILDPESGNEYGCSIWFEEGSDKELKVRGKHWTGLYRTQTWYRVQ